MTGSHEVAATADATVDEMAEWTVESTAVDSVVRRAVESESNLRGNR